MFFRPLLNLTQLFEIVNDFVVQIHFVITPIFIHVSKFRRPRSHDVESFFESLKVQI